MSLLPKCICGMTDYCIGGNVCQRPTGDDIPMFSIRYVKNLKEGWLVTLKVLRTMMEKQDLEAGVKKCDELIKELEP